MGACRVRGGERSSGRTWAQLQKETAPEPDSARPPPASLPPFPFSLFSSWACCLFLPFWWELAGGPLGRWLFQVIPLGGCGGRRGRGDEGGYVFAGPGALGATVPSLPSPKAVVTGFGQGCGPRGAQDCLLVRPGMPLPVSRLFLWAASVV